MHVNVSDTASHLKSLSDAALVQMCPGEKDAVAVLISRYIPLINKYAFQFSKILDFDDLVQEGSLGLLDAISSFRPDKDVKFSTYAPSASATRCSKRWKRPLPRKPAR